MLTMKMAKSSFFDAAAVQRAVDPAKRKNLSKAGAFVRRRARSSIRRRKKSAPAGQPPSLHADSEPNIRTIFFVWEPQRETVVAGPVALPSTKGDATEAQEHGGRVKVIRRRKGGKRVVRVVTIRAHPFMGPALEAEEDKSLDLWKNSVTR